MKKTYLTFLILSIFLSSAQAQGGWTTFNTSPKPNRMGSTLSGTKGYYAGFSGLGTNYAPADSTKKHKLRYKVWVETTEGKSGPFGLYRTMDSSLVIAKTHQWFKPNSTPLETISIGKIQNFQVRNRRYTRISVYVGMTVGAAAFAWYGYKSYKPCEGFCIDPGPGFYTILGALSGVQIGAIVGGLVGSFRKTYIFERDNSLYNKQRERLKKISITGQ